VTELLRLEWLTVADVFAMRQRGREVAAAVGLDGQDQIRVATALSEVGREVLSDAPACVVFRLLDQPDRLIIEIETPQSPGPEDLHGPTGIAPARRLLDAVTLTVGEQGSTLRLEKLLPRGAEVDRTRLAELRAAVTARSRTSPLEELRIQNADLVVTLDQLRIRQQEMVRLNEELEETNRGVVAMYTQLSGELEETNRGVVALYAELDEKGEQLRQANDAKSRFLRNVSHELRTPVNSVLGLTGLLAETALDREQRRQVTYLRGSANSLLELVNELLDLARAESDRLDVTAAWVDLARVFAELRGTLRPMATARGIELLVTDVSTPPVRTDVHLLGRVLRNLLTNAVSFTEHGEVRLRATTRDSGQHIEIEVTDTGIGIAAEHLGAIFEEFVQIPGPLQTERVGTGLGLPYARRVTEALGGELTVRSTVGVGSTFTVLLPVGAAPAPVAETSVLPTIGHVLVVDDDPAFRHLVRGLLQGIATRVSEAGDGEQALDLLAADVPDLMLLDLRMPNVGGAEVLTSLRAATASALRELPVVLMTSVDIDADLRRATEPAAAMLSKSTFDRAVLVRLIEQLLPGGGEA
jgi:signal transduction histidine kinase